MFIKNFKNIVVKIGSSTLIYLLDTDLFPLFIEDVVKTTQFANVTIVSSGAVANGRRMIGSFQKDITVAQKQAFSSIGQARLMHLYHEEFIKHDIHVGQILVSRQNILSRARLHSLRQTIHALRDFNVIPIINENDSIALNDTTIGDNDTLSATIACAIDADLLVVLTDVNGLYNTHPQNQSAKMITHTKAIEHEEFTKNETPTEFGSGGMKTKILAGNIALKCGCKTVITNGRNANPLTAITDGTCTIFG